MARKTQTTEEMLAARAADPLGDEAASARRELDRQTVQQIEDEQYAEGHGEGSRARAKVIHRRRRLRWLDAMAALDAAGRGE
jgi:hypothetical protein